MLKNKKGNINSVRTKTSFHKRARDSLLWFSDYLTITTNVHYITYGDFIITVQGLNNEQGKVGQEIQNGRYMGTKTND